MRWRFEDEWLELPREYLRKELGIDLVDGEGREVDLVRIWLDGEEEVVGYYSGRWTPEEEPVYAIVWDYSDSVVEVEFTDGSLEEFKNFEGFLRWVWVEWGKDVMKKIHELVDEVVEMINEEEIQKRMGLGRRVIKEFEKILSEGWEELPKGWDKESLKRFWNSLTGGLKPAEGGVTECIAQMEGKVDDPAAFCASLADRIFGKGWRSEVAKERRKEESRRRKVLLESVTRRERSKLKEEVSKLIEVVKALKEGRV